MRQQRGDDDDRGADGSEQEIVRTSVLARENAAAAALSLEKMARANRISAGMG